MQRLSKLLSLLSTIFLFVVFLMFINLSVIQTHKQTGINVSTGLPTKNETSETIAQFHCKPTCASSYKNIYQKFFQLLFNLSFRNKRVVF